MAGSAPVHPVEDDMDPRRAFVVSTIIDSLAVPTSQRAHLYSTLASDDKIGCFLEEPSASSVSASSWKEKNGRLRVETACSVDFPPGCDYQVVFSKQKPGVVSVDDIPGGIVVFTRSSPQLSSLHHLLRTVYAPLLKNGACDKHLQDLLMELETELGTALRRNGLVKEKRLSDKQANDGGLAGFDLTGVLTPLDEFQVWLELAMDERVEPETRAMAAKISKELDPLRRGFSSLSTLSEDAVLEHFESARPILDNVWQLGGGQTPNPETPVYTQQRMTHLLTLLSESISSLIVERIRPLDTWQGVIGEVERMLTWAIKLIATWERDTLELTKLAWPMRGANAWAGDAFASRGLAAMRARLDEMLKIREVHEELILLLSPDEAHFLTTARCFEPFHTIQALDCSAYNELRWKAAVAEHYERVAPIETRIAEKLRETFGVTLVPALTAAVSQQGSEDENGLAQPSQVFQQLKRYGALLARPIISEALSTEKKSISALLSKYLASLRSEFDDRSGPSTSGHGSSDAIRCIIWSVHLESKVDELMTILALFVEREKAANQGASSDLAERVSDLRRDVIEYKKAQFRQWDADIRDKLPDMALEASGRLMDLNAKDGHVEVHFSDDLVKLVREVRELSSLGFPIKADVSKAAENARKFTRHGMVLKQVANFYNEISTQMVPCQKSMMLEDALRFEQVLKSPRDGLGNPITWSNVQALQDYISRLQEVAMNLTEKNRKLRKKHAQLGEKVAALMGVDLVRQRDKWKEGVKELRAVFDGLEKQGIAVTRDWKAHWDHQLYKALQYQYRKGFDVLNESLPQMSVKLVFKQKRLQFEPGFEEIRQAHFREVQKFLNIPQLFKGVGDSNIFRHMMKDDALVPALASVYEKAEVLLQKLVDEQKKLSDWVALGTVDLEEFVDAHLEDVQDWELNFRILKMKSKESDAIPAEVKVNCYTIVTIPTKIAVEEQMKRLQEALCNSLRRKAVADKDGLEKFIEDGKKVLEGQPQSVEEIGRARQEASNLVSAVPAALETRRKCEEKLRLLRQVSPPRAATVDLSGLLSQWDDFTARLSQHEAHLTEQKEKLRVKIDSDMAEFCGRLEGFAARWAEVKPKGVADVSAEMVMQKIEDAFRSVQELEAEAERFVSACSAFEMETPEGFKILEGLRADVRTAQEAWGRYGSFSTGRNELAGKLWTTVRGKLHVVEEFLLKWAEAVKGSVKNDPVSVLILQETERYRKCLPFLRFVREDIKWAEVSALLGMTENGKAEVTFDDLTLGHFLARADAMVSKGEELKALHAQAQGEVIIRDSLHVLKVWGLERRFTLIKYESGKPCALIKEWKDIMTEVGDHQSLVQSLKESPFFPPFKDETSTWERRLGVLTEGLQQLNGIQRKRVYLEPIFARGALPQEQVRFRRVDEEFRQLMGGIEADTLVVSFAEVPRLRETLPRLGAQLDICQKALSDFLEEKRSHFPRFYFIGDDDMLEILGQAKNPTVIQAHLKKLFAGIHSVNFSVNNQSIVAMKSVDGEVVTLLNPVVIRDRVEDWLSDLAVGMKATLKEMLAQCLETKDYAKFPMQILCLADQIDFTQRCEAALQRGASPSVQALQELVAEQKQQLKEYTSVDMEGQHVLQLKIKALILDLIHNVDVLEQLIDAKACTLDDWAWMRQLRFYRSSNSDGAVVRMAESEFEYSFEYQGNTPKLVYTPLSDKCYLTLTQGMHLGYGGNPYGPAGTGKTESVKALGQFLGRQVLVFNCDEQFDFRSMGRIFTGLVKCGAWGCFDEFNRLEEDVLSAVSQQIQTIQAALKDGAKSVAFLGQTISVDRNAGIFVTLNPAGKGYGGRSKLPDNLKALFRSVAMTVPDNELIAEVNLISEGFQDAKPLGRKLVALFSLGRQLLSKQQHYDWGLRALKTVLGTAGQLLHQAKGKGEEIAPAHEAQLIVRSLRVTTLPKLAFADTRRFVDLVADIFPDVSVSDVSDAELEAAIGAVCREMKLESVPAQVEKVLQLHMACKQRIGVIVVGPSGTGKTTLRRILEGALRLVNGTAGIPAVKVHVMNPKAISRQQLLGHMDMDTREWFDGVLTAAARQVVRESADQHSWIVCDGDVDPEWIESLNSVLDDNHLLTLPSGERIQFGPNVNFVFECQDLKYASPATVSRTGMIFLSGDNLDAGLIVKPWLASLPDEVRQSAAGWIHEYFHKALQWVLSRRLVVETTKVGTLHTVLSHLTPDLLTGRREFLRGLARGFGTNLDCETSAKLVEQLATWSGESVPSIAAASERVYLDTNEATSNGVRVVLTEHMRQGAATLLPWLETGQPVLLSGPEGAGKTTLLDFCFSQLKSTAVSTMHCSAQTNASHVVQKLVQMCGNPVTTASGRVLRPRESERLVLVLKDVNLPKPDKYETMQLVQFLQQLITYKGYYNEALEFIGLERIQIVASMNPVSSAGRHPLSSRFTSIVRVASLEHPPKAQLEAVYAAMLAEVIRDMAPGHPTWGSESTVRKLASSLLEVYDGVLKAFPTEQEKHYLFTPRSVTEWIQSLRRYDLRTENILSVLVHEASRVFSDRLVGPEARAKFERIVAECLTGPWRIDPERVESVYTVWAGVGDGRQSSRTGAALARMPAGDYHKLVQDKLAAFGREFKDPNIFLFPEILERIAAMERVLTRPGGSLLLLGRSGVGRRSCTRLVAYMHHMELVSPSLSRSYDLKAFKGELKVLLSATGIEGKKMCLLLEDQHLAQPAFLEVVNSLLSGGEVPGLYTNEELQSLLLPLQELMASDGFQHKSAFSFFVSRVRQNLHVILSMDPSNPDYDMRCASNPALFAACSVLWMETWSQERMQDVPRAVLSAELSAAKQGVEGIDDQIVSLMASIHTSLAGEEATATPRQYVGFLEAYKKLFGEKRAEVLEKKGHLQAGLDKLAEAAGKVGELSQQAAEQQILLTQKQTEAEAALVQITDSMARAGDSKAEIERLRVKLAAEEQVLNGRKEGIQAELSEIQPLIDSAKKAVGQIKNDNLNEIRSLKMPPDAIRDVLEGVLLLMGNYDTSWTNMKKFLGSKSVKDEIVNFDARKVTPDMRASVQKLLAAKGASFEHERIYRVSVAAAPMAAWVKANVQFSVVLEKVKPLEDDLAGLQASLDASRARVKQCENDLASLDGTVSRLKEEFARRTGEAEALKIGLQQAKDKLAAAESLTDKLGGEKVRWEQQIGGLEGQLKKLPLEALLAAAFITYLPGQPEDFRRRMLSKWQDLAKPTSDLTSFDFKRYMSTESEMLTWKAEGLPSDDLSVENAIVLLHTKQVPLVIDPSAQAAEWLKKHLRDRVASMEVVAQQDSRFTTTLELAVRFGKTLLVHEVDSIEPMLYPLLRRDVNHQNSRLTVQIGDKSVDYNKDFRMFLVTRDSTLSIPPDAVSLILSTNFTVTRSGLEGQLLGLTIQSEQPKLEQKRSSLLKTGEEMKVQLASLEKQLLEELATSQGNILDNRALVASLNETKVKSTTVATSLLESQALQRSLDARRETYRPLAVSGSRLYFLLKSLPELNRMYQFSLSLFLRLFKSVLSRKSSEPSGKEADGTESLVAGRIAELSDGLIHTVFGYVTRSLFKADRLTFGLHLAQALRPCAAAELQLFTGQAVPPSSLQNAEAPSWVPDSCRTSFNAFQATLPSISQSMDFQTKSKWDSWMSSASAEIDFPPHVFPISTPFQRLLLTQALRPDRLESGMELYVRSVLGLASTSPEPFSLGKLHQEETTAQEPVIFITSPGADPSQELEEFAARTVGLARFRQLAMGQGQSESALAMLREAARAGDWVCFKNLHLVVTWLPVLEKEVHGLEAHPDFRLWLTSEPHDRFPPSLLMASLKVTYEAPPGLKKNLQRTYEAWTPDFIAEGGSAMRAQLLFVLAWFHAIVQERRTFVPQGWSKFYEFSFADLRSGADIVSIAVQQVAQKGPFPWDFLRGLLENAIYGGRIDNRFDVQVLRAYLHQFFNEGMLGGVGGSQKALPGTKGVIVPASLKHGDYLKVLGELQEGDTPAMFGLPANIERNVQQTNSANVVARLKTLSFASPETATGAFDRGRWSEQLSPLITMWERLVGELGGLDRWCRSEQEARDVSPTESAVFWECQLAASLVKLVSSTLGAINQALSGQSLLSQDALASAKALLGNSIPQAWDRLWEGPEEPSAYLQAVFSRIAAQPSLRSAVQSGSFPSRGSSLNLGHLFNPETFLNALRQQTARRRNMPMDEMKLATTWDLQLLGDAAADALQVTSLLIQGASFDGSRLADVPHDAPFAQSVPPVYIAWIGKGVLYPYRDHLAIPLYNDLGRSRFLTELQLPLAKASERDRWLLTGLATFVHA